MVYFLSRNFIRISRDDLRHITIDENTDDIYYFKKSDWNNYTEEVRRIKEKDKNAFLKIYDNALNVYKSMARIVPSPCCLGLWL